MDASEVIPAVPEHNGCAVVLPPFTEGIREPREATEAHAQGQVRAFDNRRANAIRVRLTHNWDYLSVAKTLPSHGIRDLAV